MTNSIDYWYQKYLKEKEKKDKLEELSQAMYDRMQNLTTDCTGIRAAMDKWWYYINYKLNKED